LKKKLALINETINSHCQQIPNVVSEEDHNDVKFNELKQHLNQIEVVGDRLRLKGITQSYDMLESEDFQDIKEIKVMMQTYHDEHPDDDYKGFELKDEPKRSKRQYQSVLLKSGINSNMRESIHVKK
jgi:hypothetical protein